MSDIEEDQSDIDEDNESDKEELIKTISSNKSPSNIKSNVEILSDPEDDNENIDDDDDDDYDIDPADLPQTEEYDEQNEPTKSEKIEYEDNDLSPINSDVDSDEEDYHKLSSEATNNYINTYHSECFTKNSDEINALAQVTRINNIIVDENHKSNPILTKYEKTKILGLRTKQLNTGCEKYIDAPNNIIDNYLIAQLELKQKKIPMIIRRPISNTKFEYWKLEDLEQIY